MALSFHIPYLPESIPFSIQVIGAIALLGLIYYIHLTVTAQQPWPDIPVASLSGRGLGPRSSWRKQGKNTVLHGLKTFDGPFQVLTGTGPKIILPNKFAEELKTHPDLNFNKAVLPDFFTELRGFEPFKLASEDEQFLPEVVRVKLTQSLGLITNDLVDETTAAVHDIFGEDPEWHHTFIKQNVLDLVARLSSRVFLGPELCRNARWLEIAKSYTINAFISARLLKLLPALIRPLAHWVLPPNISLRRDVRDADKLIMPEVERRKERAQKALDAGMKPPKTADTIGWMYELAREKREQKDYVKHQLGLSMAAIHTTSEAITQAMLDLVANLDIVQPLRDEIIQVIGNDGWSKTSLYRLRLMDSFVKESQRVHPPNFLSMMRMAERPITLSTGQIIPAGARIMLPSPYEDPAIYSNPQTIDPYRFLREREKAPEQINTWQHVTVTSQHMAFGYGQHACPGRFFASNEIKIAMAHLLLKYDWKDAGDDVEPLWEFESSTMSKSKCRVQLRRRKEEISVDLPE